MSRTRPGWALSLEGRIWLLTTFLLLVIGIARGINLLALLGCVLLAVLLLQAFVLARRLRGLTARRWVEDAWRQDMPCRVEVRLSNDGLRAVRGVVIEDAGQEHVLTWYLDNVEGRSRSVCRGEVVPPCRGTYRLEPLLVGSSHPFGLVQRFVSFGEAQTVLVLPRIGKVSRERLRRHLRGTDPRGERTRQQGARHEMARADFHGLRPYRAGDSLRWVHWRTSARRGQLMVKEFEDVPGDDLVLVLDPTFPEGDPFEEAVSLAATLVSEWCRRRGDRLVLVIAGPQAEVVDGLTGPEQARRALEALAVTRSALASDGALVAMLRSFVSRSMAVIVVAAGESALPSTLERGLGKTVTLLDITRPEELPFYQAPSRPIHPSQGAGP